MMNFEAKLITSDGVTCIIGGQPYTVATTHPKYKEILESLKLKDSTKFLSLYSTQAIQIKPNKVGFKSTSSLVVGFNDVTYNGKPLHNRVTERLLELQQAGHDIMPLSCFLDKLMKNPSNWCVEALYKFMEAKGLPLTEDGDVLAYKVVDSNYMDKYSRKFNNSVGNTLEIPRNTVDDDRTKECSYGFHVGDLTYSGPSGLYKNNGDKVIIVRFSPEDVVGVPEEANCHKIRLCKYTVIADYKELPNTVVNNDYEEIEPEDDYEDDYFDDDDYEDADCIEICDCVYGDHIKFEDGDSGRMVKLKFEGISKRHGNKRFYGRLLPGGDYGDNGKSASFNINSAYDIERL